MKSMHGWAIVAAFAVSLLIYGWFAPPRVSYAEGEQAGRYEIVVSNNITFMIDTATGKTWRFTDPGQRYNWRPLRRDG